MTMFTRRSFLQTSALATGAALLARSTPSYARTIGANDRLRIAVVGLNGRGKSHISGWSEQKNVEIAYLIDPDQQVLERSLADLKKKAGQKFAAKGLSDLRRALEDPTLDAISIATPNHLHALQGIWAAQAGKDVYVEKPVSHNIWEGRQLVTAATKYNRVIQCGTQIRSGEGLREAVAWVRSGQLGRVTAARGVSPPRDSRGAEPRLSRVHCHADPRGCSANHAQQHCHEHSQAGRETRLRTNRGDRAGGRVPRLARLLVCSACRSSASSPPCGSPNEPFRNGNEPGHASAWRSPSVFSASCACTSAMERPRVAPVFRQLTHGTTPCLE